MIFVVVFIAVVFVCLFLCSFEEEGFGRFLSRIVNSCENMCDVQGKKSNQVYLVSD